MKSDPDSTEDSVLGLSKHRGVWASSSPKEAELNFVRLILSGINYISD